MFWFIWLPGMWGARGQTHNPFTGRQNLNHWNTREVPKGVLKSETWRAVALTYIVLTVLNSKHSKSSWVSRLTEAR